MTGRALMGVGVLALFGFGGCGPGFKDVPPIPPPADPPPVWSSLTVGFLHTQVGNPATGWVTTVTVPTCTDVSRPVTITASVSNGSLVDNGNGTHTWTRVVTGAPPVQRVAGTFTANCTDLIGQTAHPTLALTVT
ncbi:MAG: hypothetical protein ACT4PI_14665 [Actinomycetota bacterium]